MWPLHNFCWLHEHEFVCLLHKWRMWTPLCAPTLLWPAGTRSGEAQFCESGYRQRRRAPLLVQLQSLRLLGPGEPAVVQQAEEVEALAHLCGVGQHVVAADQLLPGARVSAAPQQNLHQTPEVSARQRRRYNIIIWFYFHLQSGVDAHVLQERPLSHGSQTGHAPSSHPPQVAKIHVSCEVGRAGRRKHVMEPVASKSLNKGGFGLCRKTASVMRAWRAKRLLRVTSRVTVRCQLPPAKHAGSLTENHFLSALKLKKWAVVSLHTHIVVFKDLSLRGRGRRAVNSSTPVSPQPAAEEHHRFLHLFPSTTTWDDFTESTTSSSALLHPRSINRAAPRPTLNVSVPVPSWP